MTEQDKQRIVEAEAKAWKSICTSASVVADALKQDASQGDLLIHVQFLSDKIESEKRRIDRLIDSIKD